MEISVGVSKLGVGTAGYGVATKDFICRAAFYFFFTRLQRIFGWPLVRLDTKLVANFLLLTAETAGFLSRDIYGWCDYRLRSFYRV